MLKKQHRLTSDFEYKVTKKYGKKYPFQLFNMVVCKPIKYEGPPKIGVVVSTALDKRAVKRNHVKRQFREILRKEIERIPYNQWVVIYPKQAALTSKYEELSTEINKAISEVFIAG